MTDEKEREVARWVANLVQREYDLVPGPPTERDGVDGSGLTVDFTYDGADPPFAVEITRLRDDFERAPEAELRGLEKRLRRHVASKGLPHWSVGIRTETKLRSDLEPAIRQMIEWMLAADLDTLGRARTSMTCPPTSCTAWAIGSCGTATPRGWQASS